VRNPIISFEGVDVEYGTQSQMRRRVLRDIHLEIGSGEFVSIVGPTGCGKSTLLRLILGEQRPTSGCVLVNGAERFQPDGACGYVPQKYSLFPDKTVLQNVTFGSDVAEFGAWSFLNPRRRARMREFRAEALRCLQHMGLQTSDTNKYPHQLSGGMQQRVAIAQALIMRPGILLMDEAFSALDPGTRRSMQRLIKDLWRETGTTIVFVTHNTREAICIGTRVVALANTAVAMDVEVPHLAFDSDETEIGELIETIENATQPQPSVSEKTELAPHNLRVFVS
jgi:NitT/TauT family transport system ATP-binding protein